MFAEETEIDPRLHGVGGWLLFFVVTLTILLPLGALGVVVNFVLAAKTMLYFQPFGLFALVVTLLDLLAAVIGLVIGIFLWRQQNARILRAAQMFLLVRGGYVVISRLFLLFNLSSSHAPPSFTSALYISLITSLFMGLGYSALWYLYLDRSRRVQMTYVLSDLADDRPPAPPQF